jgi:hypothetical protein
MTALDPSPSLAVDARRNDQRTQTHQSRHIATKARESKGAAEPVAADPTL